MQNEMPLLDKRSEMLLQRIAIGLCGLDHFPDADAANPPCLARRSAGHPAEVCTFFKE